MRPRIFLFVCLFLTSDASVLSQVVYPGTEWSVVENPVAAGLDVDALARLDAAAQAGQTTAMTVVHRGRVIYQYGEQAPEQPTYIASVRKSVLAMLMGDWVEDGTINLDASLVDLGIDDIGGLSDRERSATLRDLIAARSGIYHDASNASGVTAEGPQRDEHAPGSYWWYNNWDFNAAGTIFEKLTSQDIYEAFQQQLAGPLGLQDFDLERHLEQGKGGNLDASRYPAYHFFLSSRDLARLGLLMLQEGRWEDRQLVPAAWVKESTSALTPVSEMNPAGIREGDFGYGYMWWVFDSDDLNPALSGGYSARGHFGQYIIVLPAIDLVIAHKTRPFPYETPEEYAAGNVTWQEMRELVVLAVEVLGR